MKTIVTHFNPDTDAISSVWLLKRFMPGFSDAQVKFVPVGETLQDAPADSDQDIVHVDTGLGKFDHHQNSDYTCSAKKVFDSLPQKDTALERLISVVVEIDNGRDILWPGASEDRAEFDLDSILWAFKAKHQNEYQHQLEWGFEALDSVYENLKKKVAAEKILSENGVKFKTKWGRGIGAVTDNEYFIELGQKQGYTIVLRKDPSRGHVRIYSRADSKVNLTDVFEKLKELDPGATWYLHPSKKLLLNGSTSNPKMKPTKLSLEEIIIVAENPGLLARGLKAKD